MNINVHQHKQTNYFVGHTTENVNLLSTSTAFLTVDNLKSTISVGGYSLKTKNEQIAL